jgi:crotonobetainyl-CoA:carnitine CoA-transferase CaiB-like acyl-CoA transferase
MPGPLADLRVVDCSSTAAGMRASGVLADYGADVVWVEPPGGAPFRRREPVAAAVFNRGKRSIELDLRGTADRPTIDALLAGADVLIETMPPATAAGVGLARGDLATFPQLVHCSITAFGHDGPLRDVADHEALVHALAGTMAEQAGHRQGPIYEAVPFAAAGAAYLAVIGILAALRRRDEDGHGRWVETSLYDGALAYLAMLWGDDDAPPGAAAAPEPGTYRLVTRSFRCADDEYLGIHTGAVGAFGRFMTVLGLDDRIAPSESGMDIGVPLTEEERHILDTELGDLMASRPRDEWVRTLRQADVCAVEHLRPGEIFDQPQVRHNDMAVTVVDPVLGPLEQVGIPAKLSGHQMATPRPAPRPDEHRDEILAGLTDPTALPTNAAGRPNTAPPEAPLDDRPLLDGVTILDLGAYYAGPYSSRLLADLGADVIKLEPIAGDQLRGLPRVFRAAQAGKRSLAANLKDPGTRGIATGLLEWADIVHHNLRPGAAERLGLGYEDARAVNPDVIYLYAPGWGATGPDQDRQSFAPMLSGFVGAGFEAAGEFNPPLFPVGNEDPGNGLLGAVGMLLALREHRRSGAGQLVENPQLNATMTHLSHIVRRPDGTVLGAGRLDPLQTGLSAGNRLYETADGWICLVAEDEAERQALARVTGVTLPADLPGADLDGPTGGTPDGDDSAEANGDYECTRALAEVFATRPTAEWLELLGTAGVPVAQPVPHNNVTAMHDPELRRTGRVAEARSPEGYGVREIALLVRVSGAVVPPYRLAPGLGAHTDEILTWLGCSAEEVASLRARGAVR